MVYCVTLIVSSAPSMRPCFFLNQPDTAVVVYGASGARACREACLLFNRTIY